MSRIHLKSEYVQILKENIDNDIQYDYLLHDTKLPIEKIYTQISKILFNHTYFPNVIIDIISSYVNDLMLLNYNMYAGEHHTLILNFGVHIESKDVWINYEEYKFEYDLNIMYDGITTMLKLQHINSCNAYNIKETKNEIQNFDILTFFNEYMKKKHNEKEYIKISYLYDNNHQCCIYDKNNNQYYIINSEYDHADDICINVIDHTKLKNIVTICKLLIEYISNIISEYIDKDNDNNKYLKSKLRAY